MSDAIVFFGLWKRIQKARQCPGDVPLVRINGPVSGLLSLANVWEKTYKPQHPKWAPKTHVNYAAKVRVIIRELAAKGFSRSNVRSLALDPIYDPIERKKMLRAWAEFQAYLEETYRCRIMNTQRLSPEDLVDPDPSARLSLPPKK